MYLLRLGDNIIKKLQLSWHLMIFKLLADLRQLFVSTPEQYYPHLFIFIKLFLQLY